MLFKNSQPPGSKPLKMSDLGEYVLNQNLPRSFAAAPYLQQLLYQPLWHEWVSQSSWNGVLVWDSTHNRIHNQPLQPIYFYQPVLTRHSCCTYAHEATTCHSQLRAGLYFDILLQSLTCNNYHQPIYSYQPMLTRHSWCIYTHEAPTCHRQLRAGLFFWHFVAAPYLQQLELSTTLSLPMVLSFSVKTPSNYFPLSITFTTHLNPNLPRAFLS